MGLFETLALGAPFASTAFNFWDYIQSLFIQDERARERQQGFEGIDELSNSFLGQLPTLGFDGQAFGGPPGGFRSSGILGPNNTVGFGSFNATPFNPDPQSGEFTGPDIFNIQSREDIEQETLGNAGLAGVNPEDRYDVLFGNLFDPFAAEFDDQERGIRADSQTGRDRGDFVRQQGLDSINQTADKDVGFLRANLRGDFQGVEKLELPKADEIFRRTQEQGTRDALAREQAAVREGQGQQEDLGRLGFDAFDGSSIFSVQRSAFDQRLADNLDVSLQAEAARTETQDANAAKRLGLFNTNVGFNQGVLGDIGDIFNTRNQSVGALENNFLGLDAGLTSDLSASIDALNERITGTQQGISSGAFSFLTGLPQNTLATQSGQLGNQQQALQSLYSQFGPQLELLLAELGLISNREDLIPQLGAAPSPLFGLGNDLENPNQQGIIFAGGT